MPKRTDKPNPMVPKSTLANEAVLYKAVPVHWLHLPKFVRSILGWTTVLLFGFSFFTIPLCVVFLIPYVWRTAPITSGVCLGSVVLSMLLPLKEW